MAKAIPPVEPCPQGISKDAMRAISAPYNFVPLADWVFLPAWGSLVSQDHPFRDGLSGEIDYTLTAASPLLVGGAQRKATENDPGEVKPFRLPQPDGRYAIAGSGLKGMIRSVIEIAGFGRMRLVDDARPGLRDISGKFVADSYTAKVRGKVKAGFLRTRADGGQEIVPCRMARLNHRSLAKWLGVSERRWDDRRHQEVDVPIFNTNQHRAVADKYAHWEELCQNHGIADPFEVKVQISDWEVTGFAGSVDAFPVLTGQISDFRNDKTDRNGKTTKGKYKDFAFYDPDESAALPIPAEVWTDFLFIHGNDEKKNQAMSWPGFWRARFHRGERVPVFYLQDGDYLRIGLAYMPKLAGDYSIHDLIGKASPEHRREPGEQHHYDLADLLFGAVNSSRQDDALRGRVSFETAVATTTPEERCQPDTILNGPKPTYFPNYLTQKCDPARGTLSGGQYATYIDTGEKPPTLRGFKRYPARPEAQTRVQPLTREQEGDDKNKVKIRLHTLENAVFAGRIVFHNLKPAELGALLWALTWDGKTDLRHGLGMGKSFGFGQVRFEIDPTSRVVPNDPAEAIFELSTESVRTLIDAFKTEMEQAAAGQGGWEASPQISNLLAMADPAAAEDWSREGRELRHMHLIAKCKQADGKMGVNEFQWAKQQPPPLCQDRSPLPSGRFVLADYAAATGWGPRWRERVRARHEEADRQAAQQRAEAEAQAVAQETAGMSDDEAELFRLERESPWKDNGQFALAMEAYLEGRDTLSTPAHNRLTRLIEGRLPKLLANPHAKTGKKQKPAFTPRQIALAERVNALQLR